jgi:hypothetical protein
MHTEFGWEICLECFGLETMRGREYYVKTRIFGKEVAMIKDVTGWPLADTLAMLNVSFRHQEVSS